MSPREHCILRCQSNVHIRPLHAYALDSRSQQVLIAREKEGELCTVFRVVTGIMDSCRASATNFMQANEQHGAVGGPVRGPQAVEVNKEGAALAGAQEVEEQSHHGHHSCLQPQRMPLHNQP